MFSEIVIVPEPPQEEHSSPICPEPPQVRHGVENRIARSPAPATRRDRGRQTPQRGVTSCLSARKTPATRLAPPGGVDPAAETTDAPGGCGTRSAGKQTQTAVP